MPELPDVLLYVESLRRLLAGSILQSAIIKSPSLLRTFRPELDDFCGATLVDFDCIGKRIVWRFENEACMVFHLMIAGRFHWKAKRALPRSKNDLAAFVFDQGTMMLTEASSKKRAGLWCCNEWADAEQLGAGGLDVLAADDAEIVGILRSKNNTLKRTLADPHRFHGIGNAYSDEILHAARLSPLRRTDQLSEDELKRLVRAMRETLSTWITRLQRQHGLLGEGQFRFPERVTAFRPEMAVHGKFKESCPVCQAPVQRICYAENECNYCPGCQTDGRILADRSLSRLLKDDWPRSLDELDS